MQKIEIPTNLSELPEPVTKAVYATAGAAEIALGVAKKYAEDLEKKVIAYRDEAPTKIAEAKEQVTTFDPKDLPGKAKTSYAESKKFAFGLQEEAKAFSGKARERLTTEQLNETYDDLATRGEAVIAKFRPAKDDSTDDSKDESTDKASAKGDDA